MTADLLILGSSAALLGAGAVVDGLGTLGNRETLKRRGLALCGAGWLVLMGMVAWLWITLGRPPIRTLGETRLLYAAWLPAIAFFARWRWKTNLLVAPMGAMGVLFILLNLLLPEARVKTLMPALQSAWFVPHVVVYMAAYATLALACLAGAVLLVRKWLGHQDSPETLALPDHLLWLGFPLLTTGLVIGALWAKSAWGHYWTWDPKETWSFLTWLFYLIPLHQRVQPGQHRSLWLPVLGFPIVLLCWFGVNYLPTSGQSVHTYTNS
jgi:ABC-type transport system involved in cytochrome c biogenesis permease subunit